MKLKDMTRKYVYLEATVSGRTKIYGENKCVTLSRVISVCTNAQVAVTYKCYLTVHTKQQKKDLLLL